MFVPQGPRPDTSPSAPAGFGDRIEIRIENKYEAGVTPEQLSALIPEMEQRTRAGVMDAIQRRQMRMS